MSEALHTVIIGGGLAAVNAAEALRTGGYEGQVSIIAGENFLPYERPPLSKDYLQGKSERDAIFPHPEDWYSEQRITVLQGTRALSIDREARTVELSNEDHLNYSSLVIATGSSPRIPGIPGEDQPGVYTLRTVPDSEQLRGLFSHEGHLVIVGAGWIGLEVAAAARAANVKVTMVAPNEVPLGNILGDDIGKHFRALHEKNGVTFRLGTSVSEILTDNGNAAGVMTDDGAVPGNAVLLAVGAVPETSLAEAAGLEVQNGILVDSSLRTADPNILAAGDVANAEHASLGRLRVEHWDNAIRHGKLAAATILGKNEVYDWQPYFYTDQYDLGMEYVGHASGQSDVVIRGSLESGEFIAFWLDEGTVTAAMNVNIWDVNDSLRALVGQRIAPESLKDESIPLEQLGT